MLPWRRTVVCCRALGCEWGEVKTTTSSRIRAHAASTSTGSLRQNGSSVLSLRKVCKFAESRDAHNSAATSMSKPVPAVPVAAAVPVAPGVPLSGPPGAPPGGVYTIEKHCGLITILIALFVFPCVCCCPCDTQEVYVAPDGTRWTRTGARLMDKRCCCF